MTTLSPFASRPYPLSHPLNIVNHHTTHTLPALSVLPSLILTKTSFFLVLLSRINHQHPRDSNTLPPPKSFQQSVLFWGNLPRPYAPFAPVIDNFPLPLLDIVFPRSPLSTYLHAPAFRRPRIRCRPYRRLHRLASNRVTRRVSNAVPRLKAAFFAVNLEARYYSSSTNPLILALLVLCSIILPSMSMKH